MRRMRLRFREPTDFCCHAGPRSRPVWEATRTRRRGVLHTPEPGDWHRVHVDMMLKNIVEDKGVLMEGCATEIIWLDRDTSMET